MPAQPQLIACCRMFHSTNQENRMFSRNPPARVIRVVRMKPVALAPKCVLPTIASARLHFLPTESQPAFVTLRTSPHPPTQRRPVATLIFQRLGPVLRPLSIPGMSLVSSTQTLNSSVPRGIYLLRKRSVLYTLFDYWRPFDCYNTHPVHNRNQIGILMIPKSVSRKLAPLSYSRV